MEVDLNKRKFWNLNDRMTFGKYKGDLIKDVFKKEPGILIWYNDNVEWFYLDEDLLLKCEEAVEAMRSGKNQRLLDIDDNDDDNDEIPF